MQQRLESLMKAHGADLLVKDLASSDRQARGYRFDPKRIAELDGYDLSAEQGLFYEAPWFGRAILLRHEKRRETLRVRLFVAQRRCEDSVLALFQDFLGIQSPLAMVAWPNSDGGPGNGCYLHGNPREPCEVDLVRHNVAVRVTHKTLSQGTRTSLDLRALARSLDRDILAKQPTDTSPSEQDLPDVTLLASESSCLTGGAVDLTVKAQAPEELLFLFSCTGGVVEHRRSPLGSAHYFRAGRRPGQATITLVAANRQNVVAQVKTVVEVLKG